MRLFDFLEHWVRLEGKIEKHRVGEEFLAVLVCLIKLAREFKRMVLHYTVFVFFLILVFPGVCTKQKSV